jgi:hypothetical protein
MAGFDAGQVATLLRQIGAHDQLLADAYVYGSIASDEEDHKTISILHKAGLLRPDDEEGEFRVTTDFKRMLNRLMRKQSSYRQLTDMGKVIDALDDSIKDYQSSNQLKQQDDAEYYLEQIDDLLYETKDGLNTNLENMHYAIVSQFGFVSSLANKIRQNERYLNHAQSLLTELQQIDPEDCYEWINWPCPSEFARKITAFIYWFNQTLPRLRFIIDNMRISLFRLRRDEKQANQLRSMARFLHKHPEFEISDNLFEDQNLPETLKYAPAMPLRAYVDTHNSDIEESLSALVQALRKAVTPSSTKERAQNEVTIASIENVQYQSDFFEDQSEQFFEAVIINNQTMSALSFWQTQQAAWSESNEIIEPQAWIELVFSCYCKLTNEQQKALKIHMKGDKVAGTTANYRYHDVVIALNQSKMN